MAKSKILGIQSKHGVDVLLLCLQQWEFLMLARISRLSTDSASLSQIPTTLKQKIPLQQDVLCLHSISGSVSLDRKSMKVGSPKVLNNYM